MAKLRMCSKNIFQNRKNFLNNLAKRFKRNLTLTLVQVFWHLLTLEQ